MCLMGDANMLHEPKEEEEETILMLMSEFFLV